MSRRLAFLVPALALGLAATALAQGPSGVINAEPNPCTIRRGEKDCTSFLTWTVQNVSKVKVEVKSEGKEGEKIHVFSTSAACEGKRCPAPWIRPDTRYVFRLYDMSTGSPRELNLVRVTAMKEK